MATAGRILMIPKGNYNSATTYEMLDVVSHNGTSWVAKKTAIGVEPSEANKEHWQCLVTAKEELKGMMGYVTPEMFGAKGDGVTDDTDAIQMAVDSGFKEVVLTAGRNYYVTRQINLKDDVTICGSGTLSPIYGIWTPTTAFPSLIVDNTFVGDCVLKAEQGRNSFHDFGIVNISQTANNKYVPTFDGIVIVKGRADVERVAVRGLKIGINSDRCYVSMFNRLYLSACIVCFKVNYTSDSIFRNIFANTNGFMEDFMEKSVDFDNEKLIGILNYGSHYFVGGKCEHCGYGFVHSPNGFTTIDNMIFDWNKISLKIIRIVSRDYQQHLLITNCWFMSTTYHIENDDRKIRISASDCVFSLSDGSAHEVMASVEGAGPEFAFRAYHETEGDMFIFNNCYLRNSAKTIFAYTPFSKVVLNFCDIGEATIGNVTNLVNNNSY